MSSILKALKRIEVQSSRSDSFFTMPKTSEPQQRAGSNTRRRWFITGIATVSLVLLVLVIAAVLFFDRQTPIITKKFPGEAKGKQAENPASLLAKANIFRAKMPPGPTIPAASPLKTAQGAKDQVKSTGPAGTVNKIPAKARSAGQRLAVDRQTSKPTSTDPGTQPQTVATLKKSPTTRTAPKGTAASKKSVAKRSVPSGKPATKKTKKPAKTKTYDRMDDAKLKLQALAWFNDPAKRMAVINSRIVREGGSVEGYQVTQIRRQDVVVNDGKKSWRLEFGLKP